MRLPDPGSHHQSNPRTVRDLPDVEKEALQRLHRGNAPTDKDDLKIDRLDKLFVQPGHHRLEKSQLTIDEPVCGGILARKEEELHQQMRTRVSHVGDGLDEPSAQRQRSGRGNRDGATRRAQTRGRVKILGESRRDKHLNRSVDKGTRYRPYLPCDSVGCEQLRNVESVCALLGDDAENCPFAQRELNRLLRHASTVSVTLGDLEARLTGAMHRPPATEGGLTAPWIGVGDVGRDTTPRGDRADPRAAASIVGQAPEIGIDCPSTLPIALIMSAGVQLP